ncbi:MAG: hypothetical protein JXA33_11950 [Anaerolineae bacterium]|nr:hypothetical protein [Anaerolineae bacterium]
MNKTLDTLSDAEFEAMIEQHITQSAQWEGDLPLDTLLETWEEIERRKAPLRVQVRLIDGVLTLETPLESPLAVRAPDTLVLEDGSELVVEFEPSLRSLANV